jgi:hypothetical protein
MVHSNAPYSTLALLMSAVLNNIRFFCNMCDNSKYNFLTKPFIKWGKNECLGNQKGLCILVIIFFRKCFPFILIFGFLTGCANSQVTDQKSILGTMVAQTLTAIPTITLIPTETKSPTPTEILISSGRIISGQEGYVNLRNAPDINSFVLDRLLPENTIYFINRNLDGKWLEIFTDDGRHGWVNSSVVSTSVDPNSLPISTMVYSTFTPFPTKTITPSPTVSLVEKAPSGVWCEQNNYRRVCISNLEYRQYIGYFTAGTNSRFIVMGVVTKNISDDDIHVNPFDFTLEMENGFAYNHSEQTYQFSDALGGVTISQGSKVGGALVFLVSNTTGPKKVIVRGGFEPNIVISLQP